MPEVPAAGDVWQVDLGVPIGHGANKIRPCLVVSATRFNAFGLVTVCPITSRERAYPSFVAIDDVELAGLRIESYIQSEQVRTLSVLRLRSRMGEVRPGVLARVRRNIKRHLETP